MTMQIKIFTLANLPLAAEILNNKTIMKKANCELRTIGKRTDRKKIEFELRNK